MGNKKYQALYRIVFDDDSTFIGGKDYFETKWLNIPNKQIKRIFYKLPSSDYICLGGYDKYFHMVEAIQDLNGKERGNTKIEYAYIMGRKGNKVRSYRITLINRPFDKHRLGNITIRDFDITNEKISKLNKKGWR